MTSAFDRYWEQYLASLPEGQPKRKRYVEAFHFGWKPEHAAEVNALVLAGVKTATGGLIWSIEADGKPRPKPDDYWIVSDGGTAPVCVIRTTETREFPYDEVPEVYSEWGGEGDRTMESWRDMYWRYIVFECERLGREPHAKAPLLMERFEVVYAKPPD